MPEGVKASDVLRQLASWYWRHEDNPEDYPLQGAVVNRQNSTAIEKMRYTKGDCFAYVELPPKEVEQPPKEVEH